MSADGAAPTMITGPDGLRPIDYAGFMPDPDEDQAPEPTRADLLTAINMAAGTLDEIIDGLTAR
jgi:hypothetical protein